MKNGQETEKDENLLRQEREAEAWQVTGRSAAAMERRRQLVRRFCGEQSCCYMQAACSACCTCCSCSKGVVVCAAERFILKAVTVSGEREKRGEAPQSKVSQGRAREGRLLKARSARAEEGEVHGRRGGSSKRGQAGEGTGGRGGSFCTFWTYPFNN